MKTILQWAVALLTLVRVSVAIGQDTRVIINLSEQRAYLVDRRGVILIAPIASGKAGWSTPRGNFAILHKDINHHSRSFGSVLDAAGRVINSNAVPGSRVPPGGRYRPAPMPYYMEFSPQVGLHAGYLPGYPASHGCVRLPRDLAARFFAQVAIGTPVTVMGSTQNLGRVRKAIPVFPVQDDHPSTRLARLR